MRQHEAHTDGHLRREAELTKKDTRLVYSHVDLGEVRVPVLL